jgi:hypothetical protein
MRPAAAKRRYFSEGSVVHAQQEPKGSSGIGRPAQDDRAFGLVHQYVLVSFYLLI